MSKKTFNEKLKDSKNMPKVVKIDDPKYIYTYGDTMVIAPPLDYDKIIKEIPCGKLMSTESIRKYISKKYNASSTCPLTCGIFINIVAYASEERGVDETPYWRVVKKDGELNEKYPFGTEGQKLRLEKEGHTIIQKGKKFLVANYQNNLFEL